MKPLYELVSDIRRIADAADETGELSPELEAQLDALSLPLAEKVGNIVSLCREWEGQAETFQREEQHFAKLKASRKKRAERLRAYAVRCLVLADIPSVETSVGTVAVKSASQPKVTEDESARNEWARFEMERFLVTKLEHKLDRSAVLAAHKAGEALPPGVTVERSKFLDVR